ncbi:MAG: AraC family transcriptional regulator, partial [Bacteroidota bacterium]
MQNPFRSHGIIYSCYTKVSRESENFIPEHIFTYIESGCMQINDGKKVYSLKAGDFAFYVKNRLAKFTKQPAEDGTEYKSLSVLMDEQTLLKLKNSCKQVHNAPEPEAVIHLEPNVLYKSYAESLIAYLNTEESPSERLLDIKVQEIALLLLETKPEFAGILFNFSEPGKIDLKEFMQRNFNFNVGLERFAYLTGRSLSTF